MGTIIDFLKLYPELYDAPADKPVFVTSPALHYLTISGSGYSIEQENFQQAIQLLVGVAFSIKCNLKFQEHPDFIDYIMPPVEVIRSHIDQKKSDRKWKLILPQPNYITEEMVNKAFEIAKKKHPELIVSQLSLENKPETQCIQIMHNGTLDQIKSTIVLLRREAKKNYYELVGDLHEVYIHDPRRSTSKKVHIIIRYRLKLLPGAPRRPFPSNATLVAETPTGAPSAIPSRTQTSSKPTTQPSTKKTSRSTAPSVSKSSTTTKKPTTAKTAKSSKSVTKTATKKTTKPARTSLKKVQPNKKPPSKTKKTTPTKRPVSKPTSRTTRASAKKHPSPKKVQPNKKPPSKTKKTTPTKRPVSKPTSRTTRASAKKQTKTSQRNSKKK